MGGAFDNSSNFFSSPSTTARAICVSIVPWQTAFTRMPLAAYSRTAVRVRPMECHRTCGRRGSGPSHVDLGRRVGPHRHLRNRRPGKDPASGPSPPAVNFRTLGRIRPQPDAARPNFGTLQKEKSYDKTRLESCLEYMLTGIQSYRSIALLALALRCANTQQIENPLLAAGFRTVIIAAGIRFSYSH
jgi:hypothetical protein